MRIMGDTVKHGWIAEEERSPLFEGDLQGMIFIHSTKKRRFAENSSFAFLSLSLSLLY